jgi:hypothetical protein
VNRKTLETNYIGGRNVDKKRVRGLLIMIGEMLLRIVKLVLILTKGRIAMQTLPERLSRDFTD